MSSLTLQSEQVRLLWTLQRTNLRWHTRQVMSRLQYPRQRRQSVQVRVSADLTIVSLLSWRFQGVHKIDYGAKQSFRQ